MDEPFQLHDGGPIGSLSELSTALVEMDPGVFAFHTDGRNDFASWVEGSLGKPLLGALLRECETAHEMAVVIETYETLRNAPEHEALVSDVVRRLVPRLS